MGGVSTEFLRAVRESIGDVLDANARHRDEALVRVITEVAMGGNSAVHAWQLSAILVEATATGPDSLLRCDVVVFCAILNDGEWATTVLFPYHAADFARYR